MTSRKKRKLVGKHPIQILSLVEVDEMVDAENSPTVFLDDVLADIWPMSVTEAIENMREKASAKYKIRIRYYPGVLQGMKVKDVIKGVTMEIKSILDKESNNDFLVFIVEEDKL